MKRLLLSAAIFFTVAAHAQSDKFNDAMQKTLGMMGSAKSTADYIAASAAFERIGDAEKTQWLPYYYAGLSLTIPAWADQGLDKDANSDKIKGFADKAEAMAPDNAAKAEIESLRNMAATQQMMVDPQTRWQTNGMEAGAALQKGMQLDATNPRLYYLQGMSIFGTPAQFGGGKDKAKPVFEKAVELFKAAQPKALYPNWGKERVEMLIKGCN